MQPVNSQLNRCLDILRLGKIVSHGIVDPLIKEQLIKLCTFQTGIDNESALGKLKLLTIWCESNKPVVDSINFSKIKLDYITKKHLSLKLYSELPDEVLELSNLTSLTLHLNGSSIPKEIFKMTHLESLDLSENKIHYLPNEILKLKNLKILDISKNHLLSEIAVLSHLNLKVLNVEYNNTRWDRDFLEFTRNSDINIIGIQKNLFHINYNYKKENLNVPNFITILNHLSTCQVNESEAHTIIITLFHYSQNRNTLHSNLYEDVQILKSKENFQSIIKLCLSSKNHLLVDTALKFIYSILHIDEYFLDFISPKKLFLLFSNIFNSFKNETNIIELGLYCFSRSFNERNYKKDFSAHQHPLLCLDKEMISKTAIQSIMSIIKLHYKAHSKLEPLKETLDNLFEVLEKASQVNDRYRLLMLNILMHLGGTPKGSEIIIKNTVQHLSLTEKFFYKLWSEEKLDAKVLSNALSTLDAETDFRFSPMFWENFLSSLFEITSKKNILLTEIDSLFDFLSYQCYRQTRFLAELAYTDSRILSYFFTFAGKAGYEKKSLEAIALLMHANPHLPIPNRPNDTGYIRKLLPRQGEKLAWCGALMGIKKIPNNALSDLNKVISEDLFLNMYLKGWQEKQKVRELKKFEKEKNRFGKELDLIIRENKIIIENSMLSLSDRRENKIDEIENECLKIKSIFKEIPAIQLPFVPFSRESAKTIFIESAKEEFEVKKLIDINEIIKNKLLKIDSIEQLNYKDFKQQTLQAVDLGKQIISELNAIALSDNAHLDDLTKNMKEEYRKIAIDLYNTRYLMSKQEINNQIVSKVNACISILQKFNIDVQNDHCFLTPESFESHLENGHSLLQEFANHSSIKYKKLQQILADFTKEELRLAENSRIQHLMQTNQQLKNQNSLLASQIHLSTKKSATSLNSHDSRFEEERSDSQVAQLIQEAIANLECFEGTPPRKYWIPEQQTGWKSLMNHLNKIGLLTQANPKQFRNWSRQDAIDLLILAGFEKKRDHGSHREMHHPLFKLRESASENTQKETGIHIMKTYFYDVLKVLELWHSEITKKHGVPFGQ